MTLKDLRAKLGAKQAELAAVFAEAKTDSGYAFDKVTCLGADVKGAVAVSDKVQQMNAELDDLAKQAESLEGAEKAAAAHEEREKSRAGFRFPGGTTDSGGRTVKSLGELVAQSKSYQAWAKSGAAGGITLGFGDVVGTDMLAAAAAFETMGTKALMSTLAGVSVQNIRLPGFVEAAARPPQLIDILPTARTDGDSVRYIEETTRTHGAAMTAQGGTYGESTFVMTDKGSEVKKITDSVPVTDEQLEDVAFVESYINSRLTFGVRQKLDGQSLVGTGAGAELRGLKNVIGIQTQARGADPVPDAFYRAMTKVRVGGRAVPTHHVMHPEDWQDVRLMRTTEGVYIWGSPSEAGPERMWGLPVVQNDAEARGSGYVGSFLPAFVNLVERRGVDVQVGFAGTQFTEGRRTIRADTRVALVWFRPAAFCAVTGLAPA
ncbi:phage major capsid protein [Sphingomonas sp. VNH70]|uniref:phage major capsid protein n=1 Tax=Sphingomonas silueang TaxID=3156617 RepID=UPI0032B3D10E